MIWASWRQFRSQGAVAFAGLVVVAVVLAVTGVHLVHVFNTTIVPCKGHGDCKSTAANFASSYGFLQDLGNVLVVVPGIVGVFWGAPSSPANWRPVRFVWPGPRALAAPVG